MYLKHYILVLTVFFQVFISSTNGLKTIRFGSINGLFPAVFTPFDENGDLNLEVIPDYAQYLKQNYIDGVLVAGTSGEGPSLSFKEKKKLLEEWVDSAKPLGLKVVMQVGGASMPEVLNMAKIAQEEGADAIMTLPELYYKPKSEEDVVDYVNEVSDAAPRLPIIYYHHPSHSGVQLNIAKFFELAASKIQNFIGIKCDFQSALDITATNELSENQTIFLKSPLTTVSNYVMGFNSSMAAALSIFPHLVVDIERALNENNVVKARELQFKLNKRMGIITSQGDKISAQKAAMEMITGIKVGNTRYPIKKLTTEQKQSVHDKLIVAGVKMNCDSTKKEYEMYTMKSFN